MTAYISSYKLTSTTSSFLTINAPSSIDVGDLLMIIGFSPRRNGHNFNARSISATGQTTSWSGNISGHSSAYGYARQGIYWKIADAHDVSYAAAGSKYLWSSYMDSDYCNTVFLRIKGHNKTNPIHKVGACIEVFANLGASDITIPSLTTTLEDCLVLVTSSKSNNYGYNYSQNPSSPWTEMIEWNYLTTPSGQPTIIDGEASYQLSSRTLSNPGESGTYTHYLTDINGVVQPSKRYPFGVQIAINSEMPVYLLSENLYNAAGNPYADSTIVYSARAADPTKIDTVKVGIINYVVTNSTVSESSIRSYRGLNPTAGAVVQVFDASSANNSKKFLYVKPNTDIYGLITNEITPIPVDLTGNTLATFGLSDNGSTSTAYKLYDSGSLSVIRQAANSNSLPLSNLSGATYQWYYATNSNQQGYYNPSGVIAYAIPEETSINYYPSSSYPERKTVRCGVTYSNGSGGYDTSYTQWTPTNTFYYSISTISLSQIVKGRSTSFSLNQYVGSPSTLYYTIQTAFGSVPVYASDFYGNTLSGTVNVANNTAIANIVSNTMVNKTFYLQLRKDSISGDIVGTSDNISNSLIKSGTKLPTLGSSIITSGTAGGTDWVTSPWESIVSGSTGVDNGSVEVPLGFNFTINGNNYASIFVSSNGYYSFGSGTTDGSAVTAAYPAIIKFIVHQLGFGAYHRVAKKVSSDKVQIRFQGNYYYQYSYAETSQSVVNEVTIYNPNVYGGVPVIEICTGIITPQSPGYTFNGGFYLANGTKLCSYTTVQNQSYVLVGDATGTSWTTYTGYQVYEPVTYSVTESTTSVDEGYSVTFTINTTNIDNGTTMHYSLDGTTTSSDFVSSQVGSFTVTSNTATVVIQTAIDTITESETFIFNLRTGATTGTIVASSNEITINNTSPTFSVSESTTSVNETDIVTFTVNTTNVPVGYILYYTLDGDISGGSGTASPFDFVGLSSGSFAVTGSSTSVPIRISFDNITDIGETFYFNLRTVNTSGTIRASSSQITINNVPATFAVTPSATSVNEGSSITFTVNTSGVPNSSTLYYSISGTNITSEDFSDNTLTGSFTINTNTGSITKTLTLLSDSPTEGTETFILTIRLGSPTGDIVATSPTISIVDLLPNIVTSGTATPAYGSNSSSSWPPSGWTSRQNASLDDGDIGPITLPFNFYLNNTAFTTLYVNSNNLIFFGTSLNPYGGNTWSANNPSIPKLVFGGNNLSLQRLATLITDKYVKIRYEGTSSTGGTPGASNNIYEITFFNPKTSIGKNLIQMVAGANSIGELGYKTWIDNGVIAYTSTSSSFTSNQSYVYEGNSTGTSWTFGTGSYVQVPISYSVSQSTTSVNEGSTVTFTVNTTGVNPGTTLYYTLDGSATAGDFATGLSGSFTVSGSESTSVPVTIALDDVVDPETFYFNLKTGSTQGTIVATSSQITINNVVTSYDTITTSTTSVTEGSSMTFTVNTTGVPNGATLYYDLISVTGTLQTTDFGTPSSLTNNSFTITNNTATVTLSPQTDGIDDTDTFYIGIKLSTSGSYVLQSSTITINNLGVILPSLSSMRTIANAGATRRVTAPLNVSVGDYLLIFAGATYTLSNTLYNDIDPGANAGNLGGTSTSTANNPSAAGQTSRWRLLRTQGTTTSDSYIGVFYKIADAHDVNLSATSGSYVVNCYNVGAAGDNQSIFSFRIPGATTTDVMGGDVVNGSAISLTMGSITTTVPNALVMYFYVNESGNYTHTVPTGFTFGGSLGAGAAASAHWGYKTQTTAGATGSVVVSKSSSGNGSVAFMIAFK